jgi:hypothetical protein
LAELLIPECTFSYHSGTYTYPNRDAAIAFLKERMQKPECLSLHQGHHPEITLLSADHRNGNLVSARRRFLPGRAHPAGG